MRGQCESSMQWGTAASASSRPQLGKARLKLWPSAAEIPRSPTRVSVLAGGVCRWGTCLPCEAHPSLRLPSLLHPRQDGVRAANGCPLSCCPVRRSLPCGLKAALGLQFSQELWRTEAPFWATLRSHLQAPLSSGLWLLLTLVLWSLLLLWKILSHSPKPTVLNTRGSFCQSSLTLVSYIRSLPCTSGWKTKISPTVCI